jgi:hypothetical protein
VSTKSQSSTFADARKGDTELHNNSAEVNPTIPPPKSNRQNLITFDVRRGQDIKQRLNVTAITSEQLREDLNHHLNVNLSERDAIEIYTLVTRAKWSVEKACDEVIGSRFFKQLFSQYGLWRHDGVDGANDPLE